MGTRGAVITGGIIGAAAIAVVVLIVLPTAACGCSQPPDPEQYVGMSGVELASEFDFCEGTPASVPREHLTWWTVVGEPLSSTMVSDPWTLPEYTLEVVPYATPEASPSRLTALVTERALGTGLTKEQATRHVAVLDPDQDGNLVIAFGIAETTWGAALFTGDCVEAGLRYPEDRPALTDAQVAAWPTFDMADIDALYGPAPAPLPPLTLEVVESQSTRGEGVNVSMSLTGRGVMPSADKVWLVTEEGRVNDTPLTDLEDPSTVGVGFPAPPGGRFSIVLERDGLYYVLATAHVPNAATPDDMFGAEVLVDYTRIQEVSPLQGGPPEVMPVVAMAPLFAN